MKKNDVIRQVAKMTGIPQYDCNRVIDAFQDIVTDALAHGEKVTIRNFLTFIPRSYAERKRYNPSTGDISMIEANRTVICRVSKSVKDIVNNTQREI